jgi:hypothetical protein
MKRILNYAFWIVLWASLIFLAFNRHSKSGYFNYHSEIWADKAGYYVYLPATFIYRFHVDAFPRDIDVKTGNGFSLDTVSKKIITKYPCGVALLQLPFFILAYLFAPILQFEQDGFSPVFHWMMNVAAVSYLIFGLHLLCSILRKYFTSMTAYLTIFALLLGTNLYYYGIDETGMTHVYSFFLFAALIQVLLKYFSLQSHKSLWLILLAIISALIVVVRPVNLLFLPVVFFLDTTSGKECIARMKELYHWKHLIIIIGVFTIILSPQIIYWLYLQGKPLVNTYSGESFTNWYRPAIAQLWFSTNNGLFLYTPLFTIIITSMVIMVKNKIMNGWLFLILFLAISYIFASWWNWSFGCGFGQRCYVEYYAFFSIPLAYAISKTNGLKKRGMRFAIYSVLFLFIIINLKLTYSYDGCWYGGIWNWKEYLKLIISPTK